MTHKAARVIMGVTTQPQTGGAICVITLFLPQKSGSRQEFCKIMRFKWKHKKCKTEDKRGKIPNTTPISERPDGAENRTSFGHWESDTVLGMRKTGCFGTHVERKSGFLVAFRIDNRQDNAFNKATIQAFSAIPPKLKKSFTVDNGKEFAAHQELAEATGMKVYFCEPYSPWQRGTNENTNGLLRHFSRKALPLPIFPMMICNSLSI